MKNKKTLSTFLLWFVTLMLFADSGNYICGHFRRDRTKTVPALKASGFTFGILFNVHVKADGTLVTDEGGEAGGVICKDGKYVFDQVCPYYVDDVNSLLIGKTSFLRLEYCIGGWGNDAYKNIANLVNAPESSGGGTGPTSILYKNFKALKDAIPAVIAINNDIEQDYSYAPHAKFHVMLYDLGFRTTIAPYTQKTYWKDFVSAIHAERPGAVDRNYLQCYGGGSGNRNQINNWKIGNIPIYGSHDIESGGWSYAGITNDHTLWKRDDNTVGGFYWNYNWNRDLKSEAKAINDVYGGGEVAYRDQRVAMMYHVKDYKCPQVDFSMGSYTSDQIKAKGFEPTDLAAVKLKEGVKMILYTGTDNTGDAFEVTSNTSDISGITGNKKINSWTITAECIESLDGKEFFVKNKNSGYFLKPTTNQTSNNINIQQKENDNTDFMIWKFEKVKDGLYKITNKGSKKSLQVRASGFYDNTNLVQHTYSGDESSHFIVTYDELSESYKFIALNSLKYVGLTKNKETVVNTQVIQSSAASAVGLEWELLINNESLDLHKAEIKPINIYPSIVKDAIFIEGNTASLTGATIIDLNGYKLIETKVGETIIDVSSLSKGSYLLILDDENYDKPHSFKFIKD